MLEAAGIPLPDKDVPLTWDEFVDISKQLTVDTDGDGAVDQWGTGLNVQWNLQSLVWSNGGDWTNEDRTEVTVDTPEFAEALQKFADLTNVDKVTPSASDAATLDTYQRWMAGEIGFFPVGPWDVSVYNELDFEYDLIPWPAVGDGGTATWLGSLGIGVSATSKHPDDAVKLVTYLSTDADAQQTLVDANIQIPNLIDMAEAWAAEEGAEPANRQEFLDIAQDYGRAMPAAFTYGAEWYDELWTNIQPVLDGKQTAADYLAEEQPKMQALLDESNATAEQAAAGKLARHLLPVPAARARPRAAGTPGKDREMTATVESTDRPGQHVRATREAGQPRLHRTEHRWALAFVAAPIIGFLLFTLYPICFAVYASLTSWNGLGPMTFIGLDNYVTLFGDEYFRDRRCTTRSST